MKFDLVRDLMRIDNLLEAERITNQQYWRYLQKQKLGRKRSKVNCSIRNSPISYKQNGHSIDQLFLLSQKKKSEQQDGGQNSLGFPRRAVQSLELSQALLQFAQQYMILARREDQQMQVAMNSLTEQQLCGR